MFHVLARYDGFCADCDVDMPLVLLERGPRGLRAWFAGSGVEDRSLTYTCRVCGRNEHVPLTEAEDALYDVTLPSWPDTVFALPDYAPLDVEFPDFEGADVEVAEVVWSPATGDVFAQAAALHLASVPVQTPAAIVAPAPVETPERRVAERRSPLVRRIDALPRQRVHATDGRPLAVAVAVA